MFLTEEDLVNQLKELPSIDLLVKSDAKLREVTLAVDLRPSIPELKEDRREDLPELRLYRPREDRKEDLLELRL